MTSCRENSLSSQLKIKKSAFVGVQWIYGCKIQRQDMSRLRTISETILALERRVWGRWDPGRPSYALVQQRQKPHPPLDNGWRTALPLYSPLPFLNYDLYDSIHSYCFRYRLTTFDYDPFDQWSWNNIFSRIRSARAYKAGRRCFISIELFRDIGVPARFILHITIHGLYFVCYFINFRKTLILVCKQFKECNLGAIDLTPLFMVSKFIIIIKTTK